VYHPADLSDASNDTSTARRFSEHGSAAKKRMHAFFFYADCYHEVEEVTSGSRLALVYTLYHSDAALGVASVAALEGASGAALGASSALGAARLRVPSAAPPQPATKDLVGPSKIHSKRPSTHLKSSCLELNATLRETDASVCISRNQALALPPVVGHPVEF